MTSPRGRVWNHKYRPRHASHCYRRPRGEWKSKAAGERWWLRHGGAPRPVDSDPPQEHNAGGIPREENEGLDAASHGQDTGHISAVQRPIPFTGVSLRMTSSSSGCANPSSLRRPEADLSARSPR